MCILFGTLEISRSSTLQTLHSATATPLFTTQTSA